MPAVRLFTDHTHGTMDVLFNCAGVLVTGRFGDVPLGKLLQIIRVNVEGTIIGTHVSLPLLRATPGARVINMASAAAFYGVPEMAAYSASKAAIRGLTEALNLELEKEGITVADIMPSFVDTPMVSAQAHVSGSVRSMGIRLKPAKVADAVWRATKGSRVHWVPEWRIWMFNSATCWSIAL